MTRPPLQTEAAGAPQPPQGALPATRDGYLRALTCLFTLFNSFRVLAYLPTIWAIWHSGSSQQHSIWTWAIWAGANATMAAWLYESNGQRRNRAVVVNTCNATMCLVTLALVLATR